ncbi:hypothetical protein MOX02_46680 [Methylobacterium oxalidis]|uniref:Uncharacterized protein n=1 Tax=Methylobacterium oxalidis TaxID=944322 RepID=A0A512J9I8_9HYPH|nr:hypothetical protein MOX02_46680 [Methylobacterium oxalidis]GLS66244.1 hypothetical protein GCM10007888_46260 [Methylobacterium oxalidis]
MLVERSTRYKPATQTEKGPPSESGPQSREETPKKGQRGDAIAALSPWHIPRCLRRTIKL